jgi:hypothetical protein
MEEESFEIEEEIEDLKNNIKNISKALKLNRKLHDSEKGKNSHSNDLRKNYNVL